MNIDGSASNDEHAVVHDVHYRTVFEGNQLSPGDWVVWLRKDEITNGCEGAADIARDATKNDYHPGDTHDNKTHVDRGGAVRMGLVGGEYVVYSEVELRSHIDGRVDRDPYDSNSSDLHGDPHDTSTYVLCWVRAPPCLPGTPPLAECVACLHRPITRQTDTTRTSPRTTSMTPTSSTSLT